MPMPGRLHWDGTAAVSYTHLVEPFLLTFQNRSEQVYNIQPIKEGLRNQKAITEVFVREYVLLRSTFDREIPEMEARWMPGGPIQEMSDPKVYQDFLTNTANKALAVIRARGLSREVKILSVNELDVYKRQLYYT